ncbi:MAG TPA: Tad domain-containing protein [Anaerolineales bacterium]|nr:Tad domain-containing protein [Anaerolineales bacterium]
MKENKPNSENGQVLVILVLIIVGLLAFAALAVDGGMIFADRRGAQNAADAAVLAGGYRIANTLEDYGLGFNITYENWNCSEVEQVIAIARPEGISQAATNNYPIGSGTGSLDMFCNSGVDYGSYIDKYADTDAEIISEVSTSFVHFIFGGALQNTVEAISRVRPRMPLAFGYAIYAHRDDCPNSNTGGVHFTGDNDVNINNAGIMSDACMDANGSVIVNVDCPDDDPTCDINYISEYNPSGNPVVNPPPSQQPNPLPDWALLFPEPNCDELTPRPSPSGGGTIEPGLYEGGITVNGGDTLIMNPGLYCLNDDFQITGGSIQGPDMDGNPNTPDPAVVTIYLMCDGCSFDSGGNANIYMSAPNYVVEDEDGVTGMLIYLDHDNGGQVNLLGGADSYYNGTVFGANQDSQCEVGGTGSLMSIYNTQIICGTIFVHGNATINVNFDQNNVYYLPARLTLEK